MKVKFYHPPHPPKSFFFNRAIPLCFSWINYKGHNQYANGLL
jgi:hypothetical protein